MAPSPKQLHDPRTGRFNRIEEPQEPNVDRVTLEVVERASETPSVNIPGIGKKRRRFAKALVS
eukprot:520662-Lingulodinium_polyedra.AAC.1